jgi:hypothetical protein
MYPPAPAEHLFEETGADEAENADAIRAYKKLLDDGIITAAEFQVKKKQLLGL